MSWKRIRHPKEMVQLGDELDLKVLHFDREGQKVSLGLKQLVPDPWENIAGKYPQGSRLTGKVTNLADYGAFVELEPGVEGLVHISEMSWTRKLRHPSQMVRSGDEVEVIVLGVDPEKKRISLGMSLLVFAGASQLISLDLWGAPLPVFSLIATTFIVNLRHVLMGL